jgi:hypothetical protein
MILRLNEAGFVVAADDHVGLKAQIDAGKWSIRYPIGLRKQGITALLRNSTQVIATRSTTTGKFGMK